jgi:hypothetical protein
MCAALSSSSSSVSLLNTLCYTQQQPLRSPPQAVLVAAPSDELPVIGHAVPSCKPCCAVTIVYNVMYLQCLLVLGVERKALHALLVPCQPLPRGAPDAPRQTRAAPAGHENHMSDMHTVHYVAHDQLYWHKVREPLCNAGRCSSLCADLPAAPSPSPT